MNAKAQFLERFRGAIDAIESRIDAAEMRPSREEIEKLKAAREGDLREFQALKEKLDEVINKENND